MGSISSSRRGRSKMAWLSRHFVFLVGALLPLAAQDNTPGGEMRRITSDGTLRIGMYLGFEGLSFRERGKLNGLEVELAKLLCEKLSKDLGTNIRADIVNQEWSQIIKVLRDKKYDAVLSAVIPSSLYDRYHVRYTRSYLDTGPTICCQERDGKPAKNVTDKASSLEGKRVVVINDPAVRRVLRRAGVFVPGQEDATDLERAFPKSATESELRKAGFNVPLVSVKEILQIDEMPVIYEMLAEGKVDAGVIDLGIIWWVSTGSPRWSDKIYAFPHPVGPYIYSVATREEDVDLGKVLDAAVSAMTADPRYGETLRRWHGSDPFQWNLKPEDFLK